MTEIKNIVEGALMAAGEALPIARIRQLWPEENMPSEEEIQTSIATLQEEYLERGIEIKEVASGYRIQVKSVLAPFIVKLWEERAPRYSRAFLETLAIIAYRQPVTRAQIEDIRGVAVSSNIIKSMEDREWIKVVGHRDVPGKPALFATTRQFLDDFHLKNLDELPTLRELLDVDQIERLLQGNLNFGEALAENAANESVAVEVIVPVAAEEIAAETEVDMTQEEIELVTTIEIEPTAEVESTAGFESTAEVESTVEVEPTAKIEPTAENQPVSETHTEELITEEVEA